MKIRKRSFCKIEMYGLLVILTALLLCIIGRTVPYSVPKQVVLNEVCSSNFTLIRDENGAYSDAHLDICQRRNDQDNIKNGSQKGQRGKKGLG